MREESLNWSNSLEEIIFKRNLDNISSFGSKISEGISRVNNTTGKDSLDLVHENFGVLDLLLDEIKVPTPETIVVDGETFGSSVVEETDFVGYIHTHGISN